MKKHLQLPLVKGLHLLDADQIVAQLEQNGAHLAIESVNWVEEFPYKPITVVDVARSDSHLVIHYAVKGNCLRAVNSKNNDPVWQDSCVEFFVATDTECYYNFEFNCIGTCLAAKRRTRDDFDYFTDEQHARILRYPSAGFKPFQEMQGMFDWDLTVAIPFDLFGVDPSQLPPLLAANFYKCADATELPHYVSWSPIELPQPNFHCPEFFGVLIL